MILVDWTCMKPLFSRCSTLHCCRVVPDDNIVLWTDGKLSSRILRDVSKELIIFCYGVPFGFDTIEINLLIDWICELGFYIQYTDSKSSLSGASITVRYTCTLGHENLWGNSRKSRYKKSTRRIPTINITLAGYLFMSGIPFKVFKARTKNLLILGTLIKFSYPCSWFKLT